MPLLESCGDPGRSRPTARRFETIVPPRGEWQACLAAQPRHRRRGARARATAAASPSSAPRRPSGWQQWRRGLPVVETDHEGCALAVARGGDDLGALRIFDPELPGAGGRGRRRAVGHDGCSAATRCSRRWMALLVDPDLALGVLETLARFQGTDVDPRTEEEPGRILHEMRFGGHLAALARRRHASTTASVDATPLFVMLLGELRRWGLAPEVVDRLLPHADRALAWIDDFGDRDGDGYVEYQRATDRGLLHQGWKDSPDAIRFADGRVGRPADRAVRGAGLRLRGLPGPGPLRRGGGRRRPLDAATARKAADLRTRVQPRLLARGPRLARHRPRRRQGPVDALASNMGHCLWTGILDEDKAALVAERLLAPELFSGWGVRTLATRWRATTRSATTTARCGPTTTPSPPPASCATASSRHAQRLILALLDAARAFGCRLPELFSGPRPRRVRRARSATRRRARRRRGRRRRRCCSCARCCGSTRGCPSGKLWLAPGAAARDRAACASSASRCWAAASPSRSTATR